MTIEQLEKANEITEEIQYIRHARALVNNDDIFKTTFSSRIPAEALNAGKVAMMAVIDEGIDAKEKELSNL